MEYVKKEVAEIKLIDIEIKNFKSIINKVNDSETRVGFKGLFTIEETELIKKINDSL